MDTQPPLIGADVWRAVMEAAHDRCQCQGTCGKKHLTPARKPGRCEHVNGLYLAGQGRLKLLAVPRDAGLPWHQAAGLPTAALVALCRPCADGMRRITNREIKSAPPQNDALFDVTAYATANRDDVT